MDRLNGRFRYIAGNFTGNTIIHLKNINYNPFQLIKSNQIKSNQIKSYHIISYHIISNQIKSDQITSDQITSDQIK